MTKKCSIPDSATYSPVIYRPGLIACKVQRDSYQTSPDERKPRGLAGLVLAVLEGQRVKSGKRTQALPSKEYGAEGQV